MKVPAKYLPHFKTGKELRERVISLQQENKIKLRQQRHTLLARASIFNGLFLIRFLAESIKVAGQFSDMNIPMASSKDYR